jgi:hypothetical protein
MELAGAGEKPAGPPWLTFGLLAALAVVFCCEIALRTRSGDGIAAAQRPHPGGDGRIEPDPSSPAAASGTA